METLFLTDNDIATLSNALCIARDACKEDAKKAEGNVRAAFEQSADKYETLMLAIELAEAVNYNYSTE